MRGKRLLTTALQCRRWHPALVALLLSAAPLPAAAVPMCPAGAVCIDESVEGANPTVTSTSPLFLVATVTPRAGSPDSWDIVVTMQGSFVGFGTPDGLELTERGTGKLSDLLELLGNSSSTTTTDFRYALASDDENGNLALTCQFISGCPQAVEDGTFQLAVSSTSTSAGSFDTYLKSDLDPTPVPEPASLVLFGTALIVLGVIRRRHGLRRCLSQANAAPRKSL